MRRLVDQLLASVEAKLHHLRGMAPGPQRRCLVSLPLIAHVRTGLPLSMLHDCWKSSVKLIFCLCS